MRALTRRWYIIGLCFLAAAGSAYGLSQLQEPRYGSTATLLFRDPGFANTLFGGVTLTGDRPERTAATNIALINSREVTRRAARRLGLSPDEMPAISVSSSASADIATVTAEGRTAKLAADTANAVVEEFVAFRREADQKKVAEARRGLEQQLLRLPENTDRYRGVEDQIKSLQTLEFLLTGNSEVVTRAEPEARRVAPRPKRAALLGGVLGLLIGLALAMLLERRDRRIRTAAEIEKESGLPVLGRIPEERSLAARGPLAGLRPGDREPFALLNARLRYFHVDRELRSVLVTSAAPGDGKSTVAWHLAAAAAESGQRVLLIEADMRRPTLATHEGLKAEPGLSEHLSRRGTAETVQRINLPQTEGMPARTLDVMTSGAIPPNPSELMQSQAMETLIEQAHANYDMVVVDTPPASVVSDAIPLVRLVDGLIVVFRVGKSTREELSTLLGQMRALHGPLLGLVANASVDPGADYRGYTYAQPEGAGTGKGRRRSD